MAVPLNTLDGDEAGIVGRATGWGLIRDTQIEHRTSLMSYEAGFQHWSITQFFVNLVFLRGTTLPKRAIFAFNFESKNVNRFFW